jgi:ParB/RepB/Spo0J family partition protein
MPELKEIPLSLIDPPDVVLGFDERYEDVTELAADIKRNGLYYPLIVEANGDRYKLRDGKRRWHACKAIPLYNVRCIVHGEGDAPAPAVTLNANLQRKDNNDAEIAVYLGELATTHKYSLEQLCEVTGRSPEWVNSRTDLLRGDPEVLLALGEGKINFSQARVLNRCKADDWRKMGLHFAIADGLPARRLDEYFQRNCSVPMPATQPTAEPSNGATEQPAVAPGIVCAFCGGFKDPVNMENIWIHRWHWNVITKLLAQSEQSDA